MLLGHGTVRTIGGGHMPKIIDLRSDTVTQPTEEMLDAMRNATVGDDFYHDDPTVAQLESLSAERLGKEAGLLVTSGTMGNLVSIMASMQRGDSLILESQAHVYRSEAGHLSAICGVLPKLVSGIRGIMNADDIESALFPDGMLTPRTTLVCVENTHNAAGGTCYTVDDMASLRNLADRYELHIHVDGARVFNAAVALGVDAKDLAEGADSLTFCLSKGLACPFGAVIVGDSLFIDKCRRIRQMVGGGMRQAGFMAAAGVTALNSMVDRLAEDHENAKLLARGLRDIGFDVNVNMVQTNIVFVDVASMKMSPSGLAEALRSRGVIVNMPGANGRIRFVTHYGISAEDIEYALVVIRDALSPSGR